MSGNSGVVSGVAVMDLDIVRQANFRTFIPPTMYTLHLNQAIWSSRTTVPLAMEYPLLQSRISFLSVYERNEVQSIHVHVNDLWYRSRWEKLNAEVLVK